MYLFSIAVTNYRKLGGLNNTNLFFYSLEVLEVYSGFHQAKISVSKAVFPSKGARGEILVFWLFPVLDSACIPSLCTYGLMAARWLLNFQAFLPCSRKEKGASVKGKEQRTEGHIS